MKKTRISGITVLLLLLLAACAKTKTGESHSGGIKSVISKSGNIDESSNTSGDDDIIATTNTPTNTPTPEPTNTPTPEPIKPVLVYSDDKVEITFENLDEKGLHFMVQNNTDIVLTIQADTVAINGRSTNSIIMSDDVAPKSKGEVIAKCDMNTDDPVELVGGQLSIIDFNTFDSYTASFVNVPLVDAPKDVNVYIEKYTEGLTSVYSDNNIDIYYSSSDDEGVHFEAVNHYGACLTVQADTISLDGLSINSIIMSDDVAPNCVGEIIAKCEVPTKTPGTIGGQLRIIDFNKGMSSYSATFKGVEIGSAVSGDSTATGILDGKTLLFEDKGVARIYYSSVDEKGVHFMVQNLTNLNLTIQADTVSVNGVSINRIIMSDDVAPNSIGEVIAKCDVDYTQPVSSIGGQLRIIDFNRDMKTTVASFVNVPIEQ